MLRSQITFSESAEKVYELMIDTGSALGLLLKTTNPDALPRRDARTVIGFGFNGPITGYSLYAESMKIEGVEIASLPAAIIESPWHDYASIGMEVLKDYIFVLNYCKAYACLKRLGS